MIPLRGRSTPVIFLGLLLVCAATARAHPPQFKEDHDRTLIVRLTPAAVVVDYRLEVDETQLLRDVADSEFRTRIPFGSEKFLPAVLPELAVERANTLVARLDGEVLDFTCVAKQYQQRSGYVSFDFRFRAPWALTPRAEHTFWLREGGYKDDDKCRLSLTLTASDRILLQKVTAPDRALVERPGRERASGDMERLRTVSATFTLREEVAKATANPALPPDPEPEKSPPRRRYLVALARSAPREASASARRPPQGEVSPGAAKPSPAEESAEVQPIPEAVAEGDHAGSQAHLHALFDNQGIIVFLLVSVVLGAIHALTPGHGKTLVAAYLVGERGTVWHALFLGLITTLTHTGVIFLVAVGLPLFLPRTSPAALARGLELVGGLLVASLGFWLLFQRLAGRPDHFHFGGHHHHHHVHEHDHSHSPLHTHTHAPPGHDTAARPRWWQLLVLGVNGGIVPCWDAVALLAYAVVRYGPWAGPAAIVAFSVGLAGVLVSIGVGVVYASKYAQARWGDTERFRRIAQALPLVSALLVTALGLWLCYQSIHAG